MTIRLIKTFFAALLLLPTVSWAADAGACYSIRDADARTYCLAKARKDPATCYSIQNSGLRSQCLAEVR